jgi:hypothetical protein
MTAGTAGSSGPPGWRVAISQSARTASTARLSPAPLTAISTIAARPALDIDALNRRVCSRQVDADGRTAGTAAGSDGGRAESTASATATAGTVGVSTGIAAAAATATAPAAAIST